MKTRGLKVLLLNYEFPPLGGGAGVVCTHLCDELAKYGHSFDLVTMAYKGLPKKEQVGSVTVHRVPCLRKKKELSNTAEMFSYLPAAFSKVHQLMSKKKYDLAHIHFIIPTGNIGKFAQLKGLPYIISTHGSDIPGYNPDRFNTLHKLILPIWRAIIRKSSIILTPSESLRQLVLKSWNGNPAKIKAIHWGIDIPPAPKGRKENRIIFAGRLFDRKGAKPLVEAAMQMDLKGWEVAIVGDGPQKAELERIANGNPNIRFYGWMPREKVLDLYRRSKIFAFPSTAESFGMVLAEAMVAEMAVITSNESACPEVVGDAGICIPPKDVSAIKNALQDLIKNPKKITQMGKKGRQRVLKNFTWKKCAAEYDKIYRALARV